VASNLHERLSREPKIWKDYQPGDTLVGVLLDIEQRESEYRSEDGQPRFYPVLTVVDDDGQEWVWHAYHSAASKELARLRPEPGDGIGIKYRGKVEGRKTDYESYRILVEHVNQDAAPAEQPEVIRLQEITDDDGNTRLVEVDEAGHVRGCSSSPVSSDEPLPSTPDLPGAYVDEDGQVF
jgi:hypothetical protein